MSLPSSAPSERFGCPHCLSVFRAGFARCPLDGAALQGLAGDPLIGHLLADRYVIEELLGEGGMGRVYRARHMRMSRRFAVKVLFGDMAADAKARTRFSREAEAVSRLNHPNVLSVVDFGETEEGLLYLVMDYIEGRELHQLLAQEAPLATQRALTLLRQLARGLAHAHERNLVHRDFKTENVVVTKGGDEELARIVDFGIAAVGEMMEPNQRLTTEGMVLGTPAYMSPEQSTGEEVDERSDLFSLGVMLYEMLCGVLPFDGSAIAIAKAHLSAEVPPISVRVPGLRADPRLEAVAMRLMAKDPAERFQSARALLTHLDAAFGRADSQEGDDADATIQVGTSDEFPPLTFGEASPSTQEVAETARSAPRRRLPDTRWLVTGVVGLLTMLTVAGVWILGEPDRSPPRRASAGEGALATAPGSAAPAAPLVPASESATTLSSETPTASAPAPAAAAPAAEPAASPAAPADPAVPAAEPSGASSTETQGKEAAAASDKESDKTDKESAGEPERSASRRGRSRSRSRARAERSQKNADEKAETKPADEEQPGGEGTAGQDSPATPETPAGPTPESVASTKEFLARYEQVGKQLDLMASKLGDTAVSALRRRYMDIPLQDALRSEGVRRDAERSLKSIAARAARALGQQP